MKEIIIILYLLCSNLGCATPPDISDIEQIARTQKLSEDLRSDYINLTEEIARQNEKFVLFRCSKNATEYANRFRNLYTLKTQHGFSFEQKLENEEIKLLFDKDYDNMRDRQLLIELNKKLDFYIRYR